MKKYERPVVLVNEELAEGVYAASGANAADSVDCWIIDRNGETSNEVGSDNSREFDFHASHASLAVGHTPDAVWVVTFNQGIVSVPSCSGMRTEVNGSTVKVYRAWDNMNTNEGWGFELRVTTSGDTSTLRITSSYIDCPL